jgi:hypothetical protein
MVRITGIAFGEMGETLALASITRKPKRSWANSIGALAGPGVQTSSEEAACIRGETGIAYLGAVVWTQFYSKSAYREA